MTQPPVPERPTARARPLVERVRLFCQALPEVTERTSHGEPAWFVGKQFVMVSDHHHDDRIGLWAAAPTGGQQRWISHAPEQFFVPPYVGGRGWVGAYLDADPDWDDVAEVVEDAYRAVAPARLVTLLDTRHDTSAPDPEDFPTLSHTAHEPQHLDWPGLLNVRDVGGLPTADGGRIRSGVLIRADSLHKLTEAGVGVVLDSGVSRIVDLRREQEARRAVHPFVDDERYLNIPVQDPADPDHEWMTLAEIYQAMLDLRQDLFTSAVAAVADAPEGAVVVHCAGGKDRTGLVVAMSLVVAGVEPEVVAADYALTEARLQVESDRALAEITDERLHRIVSGLIPTPPENILSTLRHLDERYGGTVEYLRGGGMSADQLAALRSRLREA